MYCLSYVLAKLSELTCTSEPIFQSCLLVFGSNWVGVICATSTLNIKLVWEKIQVEIVLVYCFDESNLRALLCDTKCDIKMVSTHHPLVAKTCNGRERKREHIYHSSNMIALKQYIVVLTQQSSLKNLKWVQWTKIIGDESATNMQGSSSNAGWMRGTLVCNDCFPPI